MDSDLALLRLLQLASPGLPVGGFTYSQGLEWAVEAGWVRGADGFAAWQREQVDIAATLAAEGAEFVAGQKNAGAAAGRAFHHGGGLLVSAHGVDVSQLENTGGRP